MRGNSRSLFFIGLRCCIDTAPTPTLAIDQFSDCCQVNFNVAAGQHFRQEVVAGVSGRLVRFDLFVGVPSTATVYNNRGALWQSDANESKLTGCRAEKNGKRSIARPPGLISPPAVTSS